MINTIIVRIAFLQINDVVSSILLYNDQILILKRSNSVKSFQGRWSGVSGYLEGIEDPLYRAYIEIKEETGLSEIDLDLIKIGSIVLSSNQPDVIWVIHPFLFKTNINEITLNYANCKYEWICRKDALNYPLVPGLVNVLTRLLL